MAAQLRKVLPIALLGREFSVDVDFRLIEALERAFNLSADALIDVFQQRQRVQRRLVADVIAEILPRYGCTATRSEIREAVGGSELMAFMVIVEQLQAALLFTLKNMTAEEFDQIAKDIEGAKKKPVEPAAGAKDSPAAATGS